MILAETQTFDLSTQTVSDVGLTGPSNYNAVGGVALNNSGQIVGSAALCSISLNIASVFRYSPGSGWMFISGTSKYTVANDINNPADVCWGEQGAGLYLDALGPYALWSLLDPSAAAAGWVITGNGCMLNDQLVLATVGRNSVTGDGIAIPATKKSCFVPTRRRASSRSHRRGLFCRRSVVGVRRA